MRAIYAVNPRNIEASMAAGDPVVGLAELMPEPILRLVSAQVGVKRADGEIDHVLRMPAFRVLPGGNSGLAELPVPPNSPIVAARQGLPGVRTGLSAMALSGWLYVIARSAAVPDSYEGFSVKGILQRASPVSW